MRKTPNERRTLSLRHPPSPPREGEPAAPAASALDAPVADPAASARPAKPEKADKADKDTERRCVLTGARVDRAALIRLALAPDGEVMPDVRAKAPGRGAWIGVDRAALDQAVANGKLRGALSRAFRSRDIKVSADLGARIEQQLERMALDRLGLEARAGTLLTGSERIETAARGGRLALLLHAADAGEDGSRKLDQAWRVGREAEGAVLKGVAIAAPRTILSLALGRENVVHVGVTDRGAARRVSEALARWHGFIGFGAGDRPCETTSQGSIAAATSQSDAAAAATTNEGY